MASIVIAKHQYNYSASTIYIQLIHPGSPCIYLRSYLQTLQSLTTIHSGFLGRASWLAKNNIWLFDSQPLPSLNRAEMRKPNLHDSTCRTIQHQSRYVQTCTCHVRGSVGIYGTYRILISRRTLCSVSLL